jgi:hypothetical protein
MEFSLDATVSLGLGLNGYSMPSQMFEPASDVTVTLDGLDLVYKKTDAARTFILAMRSLKKLDLEKKRNLPNQNSKNSFEETGKDMGRNASRILIEGDILGEGAHETIGELRTKYLKGDPLDFVSKSSLESGINKVLIEELDINSVKGRPFHFQYRLLLVEYIEPKAV